MNVTKENLSQCHLVYHKPYLHWISIHCSVMKRTDGHISLLRTVYSFCANKSELNPFSLFIHRHFKPEGPSTKHIHFAYIRGLEL